MDTAMITENEEDAFSDITEKHMEDKPAQKTFHLEEADVEVRSNSCLRCLSNCTKRCIICIGLVACVIAVITGVILYKFHEISNNTDSKPCPKQCYLGGFESPEPSVLDYGLNFWDTHFSNVEAEAEIEKCCPDIGCFNKHYPFDVLPFPECVNKSKISFTSYTEQIAGKIIQFEQDIPEDISRANAIIFIIHGYQSVGNASWVMKMKDVLLTQHPNITVIVVDWSYYASQYFYSQSASNTRAIGAYTALLIEKLERQRNVSSNNIWCIGHSLGAHTCGYTGAKTFEYTGRKIGRITGLDPAGPCFECQSSVKVGLHKECADLVEAIHTDARGVLGQLGTKRALGHVDFYPNGLGNQPGCEAWKQKRKRHNEKSEMLLQVNGKPAPGNMDFNPGDNRKELLGSRSQLHPSISWDIMWQKRSVIRMDSAETPQEKLRRQRRNPSDALSCSHSRAYYILIEALQRPGTCVAHKQCQDVDNIPGSCNNCTNGNCATLGYKEQNVTGIYYFVTRGRSPFCLG